MLNQLDDRSIDRASDWCVGEPAGRWDVPFGTRLTQKIWQILRLQVTAQKIEKPLPGGSREGLSVRKAA